MAFAHSATQFRPGTRTSASSKPPYLLSFRSSTALILATVNLAMFTDTFFYALIIPVLPFSLGAPSAVQQQRQTSLLLACYSGGLLACSPVAGLCADRARSRRRGTLLFGLAALAAAAVLLCFAGGEQHLALLALGRALQGVSAAVVWSAGCALLVDTTSAPAGTAVGVAMACVGAAVCVGLLVAPVVGGAVYAAAGYHAVYYVAFAVVALDAVLRLLVIEKKVARQWIDEEEESGIAAQSGMSERGDVENAVRGVEQGSAYLKETGPDDAAQSGSAETRTPASRVATQPTTSRRRALIAILKNTRILAALYGIVVEGSIMMGFDAVLPLFVQRTFHWNSAAVGILFLALYIPGFVSPLAGWLADKYGARWISAFAFTCNVPLLVCARFVSENTIQHKVLLVVLLALLGTTLSCAYTMLMAEVSYAVEEKAAEEPGIFGENGVYGLAYGVTTMAFALGGVIGPIWGGYVVEAAGWGTTGWTFALWSATAAVVVALWVGGLAKKNKSPIEDAEKETSGST
ncbi:major facilitator superfamily domain-containing protein [Biscogniauxia mediterranea]|nr:major facilitator superfamily domain-containing protein [Biscogniauxia mediterranea]